MVGIILASHGGFADGIAESAQMLFGEQDNFAHVILKPDEGPDDIRGKMETAIASFENQDEVLLIVDLWGGTPFNQTNTLLEKHPNWAIVTGMNLPMVVEALTQRMTNPDATAHQIATAIVKPAKDGIKTKPADLMPQESATTQKQSQPANSANKKTIPEGTVVGDGHIKFVLARIDSRLLHGQVATGWIPTMHPDRVIVVSDSVAKDEMRKSMIREAAPAGVKAHTVPLKKMVEIAKDPRFGNTHALLLFENPEDVLKVIKAGVDIKTVNVGSMSYKVGDVNANNVLSMNQEDVDTFHELDQMILVVIVAFLAGMEGILDQWEFHQPLVACTLIGLVTGNLVLGVILGGYLQMIALGWANIGAAVAPDAALASVASAIILVQSGQGTKGIGMATGIAMPLAVAGLFLTMIVRTISTGIVHIMDADAKRGDWRKINMWQWLDVCLQGLRIAIPAALLLAIPASQVRYWLGLMPAWLSDGMSIGGAMVVAVGYAMVINMMASREVWPFFAIGFALAAIKDLTLIALGAIGLALALMYLSLESKGGNGGSSNSDNDGTGDPLGDIIDDY